MVVVVVASSKKADLEGQRIEMIVGEVEDHMEEPAAAIITYDKQASETTSMLNDEMLDGKECAALQEAVDSYYMMGHATFAALLHIEGISDLVVYIDMDREAEDRVMFWRGEDCLVEA